MTNTDPALPPAVMRLRELALSAAYAAALRAAVRLGLADVLGDQSATVDELAKAVGADPDALLRLLRSLTCLGVFAEEPGKHYVHTDISRLLREDAPRSLKHVLLWGTEPWTWELWLHLDDAVRTGKSIFYDIHGMDFFEYLHEHWPESAEVFDKAMSQSSRLSALAIANALDLDGARSVADIAGGQGHVLATLLEHNEQLTGVLLDLPAVIANADARLCNGGPLAERAQLIVGDCRREIPVQADVYIFKNILEWSDENTILALRNAMAAGREGAKVIIIENLVDHTPEVRFATAMDLLLLLNVGGKKHTRDGLLTLVDTAGLRVDKVSAVNSYLHMVETTIPV
ncbi:MAG TPA: methyltransferase [Pseudonocardiaceae bacterium]|nr:methyltransferase [Pseudonocardiaceae bacterium]